MQVPITQYELCREIIDAVIQENPFSRSCICTGIFPNSGNVCNADSGGPAVMQGANGEPVIVGVLAWGLSCTNPSLRTVWSALAPARDWIDIVVWENTPL